MATIKSYTDIEQSKILSKIFPLESADMFWYRDAVTKETNPRIMTYMQIPELQSMHYYPCWSLAALLATLPKGEFKDVELCFGGYKGDKYIPEWFCSYEEEEPFIIEICNAPNAVDACYKMILKLHKSNLL